MLINTLPALRYRRALLEGFKALKKRPLATRTVEETAAWTTAKIGAVRRLAAA